MTFESPTLNAAVWLAGAIGLWCVASVPAYWFLSAWLVLRSTVRAVLDACVSFLRELRARREQRRSQLADLLRAQMRVTTLDSSQLDAWLNALGCAGGVLETSSKELDRARALTRSSLSKIDPLGRRLQRLRVVTDPVPELPAIDDALLRSTRNRLAVVNLILAVGLLVPIAFTNAQLTGLVLQEFIPPVQPVFGVPVAFILAVVLVIAEAGVGLLHSAEAEKHHGSERRLTVGALAWTLGAFGIIALEFLLYSQVDAGNLAMQLPLGGSAFGLMGAILGMSVFGLGRLAHSSLATIRREGTPRVLAKQLTRMRQAADDWNAAAQRLEPAQQAASEGCQRLIQLCREVSDVQRQSVDLLRMEIENCREQPPAWARSMERPLTDSEFRERESAAYLWSLVAALGLLSLAALAAVFSAQMSLGPSMALGLAAGLLAFAVGALPLLIKVRQRFVRIVFATALWLGLAVAIAVVGRLLSGSVNVSALALMIPGTAAYIAGVMMGDAVGLLRLPLRWLIDMSAVTASAAAVGAVWLFSTMTALVEHGARLLAWPSSVLVGAWSGKRSIERVREASV